MTNQTQTLDMDIIPPSIPARNAAVLLLLVITGTGMAADVANTKDEITLTAKAFVGKNGKYHIISILSNHSQHTIASANRQTNSSVFQYQLLDATGNVIPQDPIWARTYAQRGSDRYEKPRSFVADHADPGQEIKFEFDLEDAFGAGASLGNTMEISWESIWLDPTVDVSQGKDAEGKIVPNHVEKYFFPSRWNISVTLPFPKKTGEDTPPPAIDPKVLTPPPKDLLPKVDAIKPQSAVAQTPANEVTNSTSWWWALLLIPVIFIARLLMRPRNHF